MGVGQALRKAGGSGRALEPVVGGLEGVSRAYTPDQGSAECHQCLLTQGMAKLGLDSSELPIQEVWTLLEPCLL